MHPILFQWGFLAFHSYGLMIGVGFLLTLALGGRRAKRMGLPAGPIQTLITASLLAGLAGARLAYVALNWDLYRRDPLEVFRLDHGGLVFYGGLAGGILAAAWCVRRRRLPWAAVLDALTPPLVLAHALGRIGCFLNGCCYGKPTSLPWGMVFPADEIRRHPTQLVESGFLFLLFLFLWRFERRSWKPGSIFPVYLLLYGVWRFCVEFLRGDTPVLAGGLTVFQWIALPLGLGCGIFLLSSPRKRE